MWFGLLTCMLLVSLVIRLQIGNISSSILLATFSPVVAGGISFKNYVLEHTWLLTLWMYMSLVFVTYYSGTLTSHVISPIKEPRMTHVAELQANNYSIIAIIPHVIILMKDLVRMSAPNEAGLLLKSAIDKAIAPTSDNDIGTMVATMDKHACVSTWPGPMQCKSLAEKYIAENKIPNRRCYLGEELFFSQPVFIVVSPPNSRMLGGILHGMMEGGFFALWFNEFAGISVSVRVQGRRKMRSRTKLWEETELPKPLQLLEGKLKNVFLLCVTCLTISLLVFIGEKVSERFVHKSANVQSIVNFYFVF